MFRVVIEDKKTFHRATAFTGCVGPASALVAAGTNPNASFRTSLIFDIDPTHALRIVEGRSAADRELVDRAAREASGVCMDFGLHGE